MSDILLYHSVPLARGREVYIRSGRRVRRNDVTAAYAIRLLIVIFIS